MSSNNWKKKLPLLINNFNLTINKNRISLNYLLLAIASALFTIVTKHIRIRCAQTVLEVVCDDGELLGSSFYEAKAKISNFVRNDGASRIN